MARPREILRRGVLRGTLLLVTLATVYAGLLLYPQPLFAYQLSHAGIVVHATRPIPDAMRGTLERVRARLDRTPLVDEAAGAHVFICEPRWLFALFARTGYRVGGIADGFVGRHVFLRESDMQRDRLIGPSGQPVAADRPLSYFIAHELMHIAQARYLGRVGYARLPRWIDDGYADYVARDIDLGHALQSMKAGARELDPSRSGLYIRYHLLVAYALDKRGMDARALLQTGADLGLFEQELLARDAW